jgi:hypothetical protein
MAFSFHDRRRMVSFRPPQVLSGRREDAPSPAASIWDCDAGRTVFGADDRRRRSASSESARSDYLACSPTTERRRRMP